jgi:hypothetical protein
MLLLESVADRVLALARAALTLPAVFSAAPSASVRLLPVILPIASFTEPLIYWPAPLIRSLSVVSLLVSPGRAVLELRVWKLRVSTGRSWRQLKRRAPHGQET